jgi:hypothetical protein
MPEPEPAEVRHLPVPVPEPSETRVIDRAQSAPLSAPVAAATGGFLAGVATFLLVRIIRRPRRGTLKLGGRRKANRIEIAGSRSFLVDVHVLKR